MNKSCFQWPQLLIVGVSLLFFSVTSFSSEPEWPDSKLPYKVVPRLLLNQDESNRTVVFASEEQGISQIRELVRVAKLEESWAFLPKKSIWIQIGSHKGDNGQQIWVDTDAELLEAIVKDNDDIILFHYHPNSVFNPGINWGVLVQLGMDKYKALNRLRAIQLSWAAIPSLQDFAMSYGDTVLFSRFHTEGSIRAKVVSEFGVSEFSVEIKDVKNVPIEKSTSLLNDEFSRSQMKLVANLLDEVSPTERSNDVIIKTSDDEFRPENDIATYLKAIQSKTIFKTNFKFYDDRSALVQASAMKDSWNAIRYRWFWELGLPHK